MISFFICLIMSVLSGFGLAILLVEKGKDWPVRPIRIRIQLLLRKIHYKLPQMLFCTTCTSFWASLVTDLVVCFIALLFGTFYFFWPLSGFITAGIMWTTIEYLNAIDKEQNINILNEINREEQ